MTGNIDMGGHTIEKLRVSSRNNPNRECVPNVGWVTDKFLSKSGGIVEGDLDMGDSSGIVDLRDPVNDNDAVISNNRGYHKCESRTVTQGYHLCEAVWWWIYTAEKGYRTWNSRSI